MIKLDREQTGILENLGDKLSPLAAGASIRLMHQRDGRTTFTNSRRNPRNGISSLIFVAAVLFSVAGSFFSLASDAIPIVPQLDITHWTEFSGGLDQSRLRVSFISRFGATYQMQKSANLQSWWNHGPPLLGSNETVSMEEDGAAIPVFYRLQWTDPSALVPPLHTYVSVGDSITDVSSYRDSYGTLQLAANGWATPLAALLGQRLRPLPVSNARKNGELDHGYSGIQAGQYNTMGLDGVNPFNSAVALNTPNTVYLVHIGTNDIWEGDSAEVTAARVVRLWQDFVAAGCKVVGTTILPRTAKKIGWTATLRDKVVAINSILSNSWREAGLIGFRDWYSLIDLDDNGYAQDWEFPFDGIHPRDRVSWKLANDMAAFLAPRVAGPDPDIPANGDPKILSLNPEMAGGTTVANAWTGSGENLTLTKLTDVDGTVWQRLSASQPTMDGYTCLYQTIPSANVTPESTVRISCRARFKSQGNGSSGIVCESSFYCTPKRSIIALAPAYYNTPGIAIPDFAECVFLSEPFVSPVGGGDMLIRLTVGIFGSGILDVRDFKMFTP